MRPRTNRATAAGRRWLRGCLVALLTMLAMSVVVSPSQAGPGGDRLWSGEALYSGQWIAAGGNTLLMQGDGNLVLYAKQNIPLWSTNTWNNPGARVVMQSDGNLVVYTANWTPLWGSGTNGYNGASVLMQSDGHLVIYAPGNVPVWGSNTYKQAYAANRFENYGWGGDQWGCLHQLWIHESNWNELAHNPQSGAHGIPQALPGDKMASEGADWWSNPETQIRWGQGYIQGRYGTPCNAWAFWQRHHWY